MAQHKDGDRDACTSGHLTEEGMIPLPQANYKVPASLALPDASQIAIDEVRSRLIPMCRVLRDEIFERADIAAAQELKRRLEAFGRYMTDRDSRDLIAKETRRTEILIGHLLGEAVPGKHAPSLTSEGALPKDDRNRFRLLADNEDRVEEWLEEGHVTRRVLLDKIRSLRPQLHVVKPDVVGVFTTITADPPWQYDNRATRAAARNHYSTLTVDQLLGLEIDGRPVKECKAEGAHLYLWTTNAFLRQAFDILESWGFTYKTTLVWVKPQLGIGNYFRSSHEFVLFGTSGDLRVQNSNQRSWFEAKRGRHSAKPEVFYDIVEKVSPGPYLELFGRPSPMFGPRPGWTVWGDESC